MFYTLFEKRPYINYVRRIQVYTRFPQSINGVVNITLKKWYHEEDRHMTRSIYNSHMIYLYWRWIYTYIHVHVHIHTYVHTYTHIYTYICIKCFSTKKHKSLPSCSNEPFESEEWLVFVSVVWNLRPHTELQHRQMPTPWDESVRVTTGVTGMGPRAKDMHNGRNDLWGQLFPVAWKKKQISIMEEWL